MASPLPPCVLVAATGDQAATFVAKVTGHEALRAFGASQLVHGGGAFSVVYLPVRDECYFVVSLDDVRSNPNFTKKLKKQIEQLPNKPKVEYVRPFTRRLQRLLGFGDAVATQQDVEAACNREDSAGLMAIAPQAAAFIKGTDDLSIVPAVCDALRSGLPALQDCDHEVFTERNGIKPVGPCCRGNPRADRKWDDPVVRGDHYGPYTECSKCHAIFCKFCASDFTDARDDAEELARAFAKARSLPPAIDAAQIYWQQHPMRPQPFKVIDHKKIPDTEKLAWVQNEIGCGAELPEFAAKFMELFSSKTKGAVSQKAACLKLFAAYAGGGVTMESQLAPKDLMAFERIWQPDASDRCLECSTMLEARGDYCSNKCLNAGQTVVCTRCNGKAEWVTLRIEGSGRIDKYLNCSVCDRPLGTGSSGIDAMGRNVRECCTLLMGHYKQTLDDAHEPAWKRRRRS